MIHLNCTRICNKHKSVNISSVLNLDFWLNYILNAAGVGNDHFSKWCIFCQTLSSMFLTMFEKKTWTQWILAMFSNCLLNFAHFLQTPKSLQNPRSIFQECENYSGLHFKKLFYLIKQTFVQMEFPNPNTSCKHCPFSISKRCNVLAIIDADLFDDVL